MPVKRRTQKRRFTPEAMLKAWESAFLTGYDYFRELASVGAKTDEYGRPDAEEARNAWASLGPDFLYQLGATDRMPWAEAQFGHPWLDNGEGR